MTMKDDLQHRSRELRWPAGFEPEKAELFAHNEIHIDAPCERVWQHLVEARAWPQWYPNAKDVQLKGGAGTLQPEGAFQWTTFGFGVESLVDQFVPHSRLAWYGAPVGARPSFYHQWLLVPQGSGCHVVTDEAGIGPDAANLRQTDEGLMHRGHALWLATLKWVAEAR
jgi:uncharacterized protein YndB with AHSA1/START domain